MVFAEAHVETGKELRPSLPDQNWSGLHGLPAVGFDPKILGIAIPSVSSWSAAFICCHDWSSLGGFDTGNTQFGKALAMAIGPPIVLAPLFLEDGDGAGPTLADDLSLDCRPFDQRLSDL
jgi:hypothetical protein